ncbi:MAG: TOMM system kinase/cyclase fusion protein, partial [Kofleriaceae bacterium]
DSAEPGTAATVAPATVPSRPIADEPDARRDNRTARFRREMDLCARLQHPNIVGLIDSGETEDGRLFAVFQLATGKSLDQLLIDEGPLHAREAHYLMLQVLDALSCAHNLGVVHRDLKPANIMIVSTGSRRNALILDFGIGTIVNERNDPSYAKLTGHQEWVGTPHYIAPEQIRGNPPTARSDLYSWGLVYLECLSGHPVVSGGAGVALMFHLAADAIPIPAMLRRHRLGKLIERAVIKDVGERTATAASLLAELDRCDVSELERMGGYHAGATYDGLAFDSAEPGTAATVAPATVPSRPIAAQDRLVDGERRQITAVCCSLAPVAGLELDDLDALLASQHARCAEIALRFRGQLVGGLGHQVVIQFGYPTASEDDAVRAARAAIAIRSAADRDRPLRGAHALELRIGIHTGMIAYSADDSDRRSTGQIFGMIPMIASQLSARADSGAIVVSHATAQALRVHIALTSLGSHAVDGLGREVELFRLDSARVGALTLDTGGGARGPLVGRERELAFLLERWRNVIDGTGENVVIAGEAGIGKSRLVAELGRQLAGQPHTWLEAHCTRETCNRVLHPILEVLERALGLGDAAPDARLARLEAALVGFGFRPGETVPLFAALLAIPLGDHYPASELSPGRRRELTLQAVISLLLELSERAPIVLTVDDLHWADPTTLDLLGALVAATPASRILTLLCTRPELSLPWSSAAAHQLQLTRLTRASVEQLVGQLAGGKALPASVLDQIAARTDGVPLFIEELTRMVLESGALTVRGERYELTGALSEVAIPTTLRALLMSRLDSLGRAKKTAQLAAALGREFDLALLTAVGALSPDAVEQDLAALVEADLLHHKRRLRDSKWLFRQALIRDIAYESMPRRVQHKVHARIAEVIEQQFPELAAARPDLLAMHWAAADHKARAVRYAQRAASTALMGSAFAHAIRHAREAIGWLADAATAPGFDPIDAELDLRVTLGVPLMMAQGFASPEVAANYLRVLALCERVGEGAVAREFAALCGLWTFRTVGGDHPGAQEAAARLSALGERTGDTSIQLAALTAHGTSVMMRGQLAEARRAFEAGLALYDPVVHPALALVLGQDAGGMCASFLTWVHGHDGDHAAAEARAAQALAICDAVGQPSTRAFVETVLGTWRCLRGDFVQAQRHGALVEQLADEQGMLHWTAQARCIRGWAISGLGHAAEGAVLARAGIDALQGIGSHAAMTFYFRGHIEASLLSGQLEAAATVLDEARRYVARSDERIHEAGLALVEARVALAAGRRDDATAGAARARAIAERQGAGELVQLARELHAQLARA